LVDNTGVDTAVYRGADIRVTVSMSSRGKTC